MTATKIEIERLDFHYGWNASISAPLAAYLIAQFGGWFSSFPVPRRIIVLLHEFYDAYLCKELLQRHFQSVTIERSTRDTWELDNGTAIRFMVPSYHSVRGYSPDVLWIAGGIRGSNLGSGPDIYHAALRSVSNQRDNRTLIVESERP